MRSRCARIKHIDTSRAKVAQFEALVQADQASIDLARTQLGYTKVTAPIDGRTGIRMVDEDRKSVV